MLPSGNPSRNPLYPYLLKILREFLDVFLREFFQHIRKLLNFSRSSSGNASKHFLENCSRNSTEGILNSLRELLQAIPRELLWESLGEFLRESLGFFFLLNYIGKFFRIALGNSSWNLLWNSCRSPSTNSFNNNNLIAYNFSIDECS